MPSLISSFKSGFTSEEGPAENKSRFSQAAKMRYLIRFSRSIQETLSSHSWPVKSHVCKQASSYFRRWHKLWLAKKHRHTLSVEQKRQLKLKALAESLFKDKKKSYEEAVDGDFVENRLPKEQQRLLKVTFTPFNISSSEKIQYVTSLTKFDRHGYKRRNRIVVITDKYLYVVAEDGKSLKLKQRLSLNYIEKLEVTSEKDNFLLIRIPLHLKNQKGDLVLEVPFVIEMVTKMIKILKRPEILNINNPDSKPICHNRTGGKQGRISITRGLDVTPQILKNKQGNLVVVG